MSAKKISFGAKPERPEKADAWVDGSALDQQIAPEPEQGSIEPSTVKMKRLTIDVPEELHRRIKIGCAQRGVKMADVIRELLEKYFPFQ
jgi:hypothetical protein